MSTHSHEGEISRIVIVESDWFVSLKVKFTVSWSFLEISLKLYLAGVITNMEKEFTIDS